MRITIIIIRIMPDEAPGCPKCGGSECVWSGYRFNKSGKKRLRKCKSCGAKFTPDDGFLRRRFQKKHIVEAVSLHQRGLSLSKVKEHLQQNHGVEVSRWMISLWCRDYFGMMDRLGGVKSDINIHSRGVAKTNGKKNWYLEEI